AGRRGSASPAAAADRGGRMRRARDADRRGRAVDRTSTSSRAMGRTVVFRPGSMRSFVGVAALAILLLRPVVAFAEADDSGWVPAFRVGPALHIQGLDGSVNSPDSLPFLQGPSGVPDNPNTPANEGFNVSPQGAPG